MKKILLSARDLEIGGIEKSLIALIDYLVECNCEITLVLEEKKGNLLKEINHKVKIVIFNPSKVKIKIIRKAINFLKKVKFKIKYNKKYDTSISYATYLKSGSFVARCASKESILWCHADYLSLYEQDVGKVKEFFEEIKFENFTKLVFVSKRAQETFLKVFPKQRNTYYCNNLIDYVKILEKAREQIQLKYQNGITTFLNISRHDEKQKKISRIIKASTILKKEKYNFRVILIGKGKDTKKYKEMVKKYNLEKNIIFEGIKENPYPYFKIANYVILTSDYEGYPVVFLESLLLNKPIITTDISDTEEIKKGRGIVTLKSVESIYRAMKKVIENGYIIEEQFNVVKYNEEIKHTLKNIINY